MKQNLLTLLILISNVVAAGTIKLEFYNGISMGFCPNEEVMLEFSGRDTWNNKQNGDFAFAIYVDGVLNDDVRIDLMDGPLFDPIATPTLAMATDSNKEFIFKVVHRVDINGVTTWQDGFGVQTNDIRIRARFKHWLSSWRTKDFYFTSNVVPPGNAVVVGTNNLQFCSSGQIQTVTLPNWPTSANNQNYCFWHHKWVWELPIGWKVTSETGSLSGATNVYTGGKTVKIQAPTGLLFGNYTLNVRSEDPWPYPTNTQTTIYTGSPSAPSDLSYNFMIDFPTNICYDPGTSVGTFIAQSPLFGPTPTSYEWQSDAGTVLTATTTNPTTSIQFNNPGMNRYVRVRAVGQCGTSSWLTKYFDLQYDPNCSGAGGFLRIVSPDSEDQVSILPNPSIDEIKISFDGTLDQTDRSSSIATEKVITLIDQQQKVVYQEKVCESEHTIPANTFPQGLYILIITSDEGTVTKKVVIDK